MSPLCLNVFLFACLLHAFTHFKDQGLLKMDGPLGIWREKKNHSSPGIVFQGHPVFLELIEHSTVSSVLSR